MNEQKNPLPISEQPAFRISGFVALLLTLALLVLSVVVFIACVKGSF